MATKPYQQLVQEMNTLQARLAEAEETLRAIYSGEVDALVISTPNGKQVFTLQSADQPYRLFVEEMQQGAVTISRKGIILYCNRYFAEILGYSSNDLVSRPFHQHIFSDEHEQFEAFLQIIVSQGIAHQEFTFYNQQQQAVPVSITANLLQVNQAQVMSLIVTDLRERKRNEETLARLAAIVTSSNDAIISETLDGIITSWNRGAEQIFGYSASEVLQKPIAMLIPPEKAGEELQLLHKIVDGETIENYETLWLRKDGSEVVVLVSVSPIFDAHHTVLGVSKIVHDITRRKQIEQELETSRQQLQLITDALPVLISYIDSDRHYQFANQYYKKIFGLEPNQVIGKHIVDVVGKAAFETAKPYMDAAFNGKIIEYEREIPYANGTRFTHTRMIPQHYENGHVSGIIVMVEDITARKSLEQALQQSEALYRSLVTATAEGIVLHGADGRIQSCNAAAERILGLTSDQMMGLTSIDPRWRVVHEDDSPFPGETHPAFVTLHTGVATSNVVMGVYKPDDTLTWILINAQPIFDTNTQSVSAVVASFTDITERKKTEQQTIELGLERQRIKLLADFVRDTSHDLRTPITLILTGLSLIQRIQDETRRNEKIQYVQHQVLYLNRVLEQLQQMARLDSMTGLSLRTYNINTLVRDAISGVRRQVDEKQITISTALADDIQNITCEPDMMHRVLVELLENAIRFTPQGGQIQIRSMIVNHHHLALEVEDNGIGIPPDKLPHIFERFYKVDEARTMTGGAGLGLAMVKRVMELQHGSLEVESIPGERTILCMIFPTGVLDATTSDTTAVNNPSNTI
ncbi:MAG: PAS domain S-box protein [bacterium]|nr:PAS domain S-box protein [bacterium]